jgi:hypothetical protein
MQRVPSTSGRGNMMRGAKWQTIIHFRSSGVICEAGRAWPRPCRQHSLGSTSSSCSLPHQPFAIGTRKRLLYVVWHCAHNLLILLHQTTVSYHYDLTT